VTEFVTNAIYRFATDVKPNWNTTLHSQTKSRVVAKRGLPNGQQRTENNVQTLKKLSIIGGLMIMSIVAPTAGAADEKAGSLTIVNPKNLHDPSANGYSVAVVTPPGASLAFISGQGGQDSTGNLSPDFAVQVAQAYANLRVALDAIGSSPDQVAKLTVYVVDHDMSKLGVLTAEVQKMFGETLPAQTLVPVPKLAIDPMLFEVDAVVVLKQ